MEKQRLESQACTASPLEPGGFNPNVVLPYGLETVHVRQAMQDFLDFLTFVNCQLATKDIPRLEAFLMPANFSSMVGEFIVASIPKYCPTIVRNRYHNGHPDLVPAGTYPEDAVLHGAEGIEVKASRHPSGWQGHNAENVWLMVCVFESNSVRDEGIGRPPLPFRFVKVVGARLTTDDWAFSGRSETSRRTITASVTRSGFLKMETNFVYRASAE